MQGRMDKNFIAEIGEINALTEAEFAIAFARKYNLDTIVMRQGGKGRVEGVIPTIGVYARDENIHRLLIYKGEIRPVGTLGVYNGSRCRKIKALENDLKRNTYEAINYDRVRKVEGVLEGYRIMVKCLRVQETGDVEGIYELERSIGNYFRVKGLNEKIYYIRDARIQKK